MDLDFEVKLFLLVYFHACFYATNFVVNKGVCVMGSKSTVHIGATWQIRLNRPCAAAMRHYVKLLWPLVLIVLKPFRLPRSVFRH